MDMKTVAFIPIKLNSSRLAHKNILPINGYPLCWHVCHTVLHIPDVDEVYVYCSDASIKQYIPKEVIVKIRPAWLDGDEVKGFQIYEEFMKDVDADIYILAHTTSPFIKEKSIQNALQHILSGENDSAFSAQRIQTFAWHQGNPVNYDPNDVPRTQDIEPIWVETSGFYIFKKEIFTVYNRRIGFNPYIQEVIGAEAIDIDERKDYELACYMAETQHIKGE